MWDLKQNIVKITQRIDKSIMSKKNIDINNTILLSGSPRSGTTWLMEILGALPNYTYLFEPLNPIRFSSESFKVGFRSRPYFQSDIEWPVGEEYLRKIFTGRTGGLPPLLKSEMFTNRLLADKLIVKSINLNRLLPWIAKRFQLRKIILIIRHPCAVVASQLKTGLCAYIPKSLPYKDTFPTLENILEEAHEIKDLDNELYKSLKKIEKQEELLAAAWCLDNYVPLSFPKTYPWTTVIYEDLVKNGEKEITHIFREIGEKNIPRSAIRRLNTPSVATVWGERNLCKNPNEQLSKWKNFLSEKQIQRVFKIVSDFGLDFYIEKFEK